MNAELVVDSVAPDDELVFIGGCRQYKPNCQSGQFMIRDNVIGPKLIMEVIGAKVIEAEIFNYPFQKWVIVVFADANRMVSQILFKKESLDNFLELYRRIVAVKPFSSVRIQASMSRRSGIVLNDDGEKVQANYYAVEFDDVGDAVFQQEIKRFRAQHFIPDLYLVRSENPALPAPVESIDTATGEIIRRK